MTDDGFWIEPPDEPPAAPETPTAEPGAEPGAGTGATAAPDTAAGLPPQREAAPGTALGDDERDAVEPGADADGSDPTGAEGEERARPEHGSHEPSAAELPVGVPDSAVESGSAAGVGSGTGQDGHARLRAHETAAVPPVVPNPSGEQGTTAGADTHAHARPHGPHNAMSGPWAADASATGRPVPEGVVPGSAVGPDRHAGPHLDDPGAPTAAASPPTVADTAAVPDTAAEPGTTAGADPHAPAHPHAPDTAISGPEAADAAATERPVPEGKAPDRHAQSRLPHPGAPGAAAVAPTVPGPASGAAPTLTVPAPAAEPSPGTEPVAADPTGNARPEPSHPAAESATAPAPTVPAPATEPSPMPEPAAADPASATDATPYPLGDPDHLKPQLEAVLMVVESPVPDIVLAQVLEQPTEAVLAALRELAQEYTDQGRGFDLRQVAGGWRFYTRPEHAEAVEKFVLDGQQSKLTQAALETLAVVAYRQPVSRSRISAVRGVNCDGVMRTLLARGLVEEYGVEPDTGAFLYRTTDFFLERMGLVSLDELPELAPFLPEVEALEAETEGGLDGFPVRSSGPVAAGGGGTGDTGGEDPAAADAEEPMDGAPADPAPAAPDPTDTGSASVPEAVPAPDEETGQTTTDD